MILEHNPQRSFRRLYRLAVMAVLSTLPVLAADGCVKPADLPPAHPPIVWPHPPEASRIEFINAVSRPQDLNIRPSLFKRVMRYIGGKPAAAVVTPYGIATDAQDRLYVVDTFKKQIQVFDARTNDFFSFPADRTLLASPVGIAIDKDDHVYVTDSKKGVVNLFKDQGRKFVTAFGQGIFQRPTGIAVNPKTSELLVVDTLQSRVVRIDLTTRRLKGSFGDEGAAADGFHAPTNIFVTNNGDIIVADALNFRVMVFSAQGRHRLQIGRMGDTPGTFSRPKGVAADSDGNIYVVDALFDNIQVFDPAGRLLLAFGDHGTGPGEFWLPSGLYIDGSDRIYVSDSSNRRVQIFRYLKEDKVIR